MAQSKTKPDPAAKAPSILHEADIGSGERAPGQHETDQMIREIPARGEGNKQDGGQAGNRQSDQRDASKD